MKVTALEEYGLRCMVLLAKNFDKNRHLSLQEIGQEEGLSVAYSGKLLSILREAGLVTAARGRNGGYTLSKHPSRMNLSEVLGALGEPVYTAAHCSRYTGENGTCVHLSDCSIRNIWRGLDRFMRRVFEAVTLEDVASGRYSALDLESIGTGDNNPSDKLPEDKQRNTMQTSTSEYRG